MVPRINIPPLTRGLLVGVIVFTLFNGFICMTLPTAHPVAPYLTIVPGLSLYYPWVMLSAALVEENPVSLAITCTTLFFGGRYLERAWGSAEYAKFVLFVTLIPNILTWAIYYPWVTVTGNTIQAKTTINGALALEAGFLVAFKQLVPEHTVSLLRSSIRIRVKHFPAIFVLVNTISGPILGTYTALWLGWLGFFTSWIYLRFYRTAPSLATSETGEGAVVRGDASDTFAFSHFFPEPMQVAIAPLCDAIYSLLVTARICTPFSSDDVDAGNEQASARAEGGLPSIMNPNGGGSKIGGRREEAERRRALALRALDQRLNAAASNRSSSQPAPARSIANDTMTVPAPEVGPDTAVEKSEAI